jgi:hypothetical protein
MTTTKDPSQLQRHVPLFCTVAVRRHVLGGANATAPMSDARTSANAKVGAIMTVVMTSSDEIMDFNAERI